MIYLDYNATTPTDQRVVDAMLPYLREHHGNPSSGHALGRTVRTAVNRARTQLARLLDCDPAEVVFTSGGSEANNHALKGLAFARGSGHLVVSAVEHPAIAVPAHWLADRGFDLTVVGVDGAGRVDPQDVRRALRPDTILISIMLANNEVGTIQPIAEIAGIGREAGVPVHTDAAQAVGKIPVRVDDLGIDLLSVAGHKFYAPPGIGALYVRSGTELAPLVHGAGHESGRRAGTEAVPAIVGLGAAAQLAGDELDEQRMAALRDRLFDGLKTALGDRVMLNGHAQQRLPNTLSVGFRDQIGADLLARMPHVAASAGAACHSDRQHPSAVLGAMGVPREIALGAVRFSVGRFTTEAEIDQAVSHIVAAVG